MKDAKELPWSPGCGGWCCIPGRHADRFLCLFIPAPCVQATGSSLRGPGRCQTSSLQQEVGHSAPITITPITPQFTSMRLPGLLLPPSQQRGQRFFPSAGEASTPGMAESISKAASGRRAAGSSKHKYGATRAAPHREEPAPRGRYFLTAEKYKNSHRV